MSFYGEERTLNGKIFKRNGAKLIQNKINRAIKKGKSAGRTEFAPQAMRLKTNLYEAMQLINQPPVKI